MYYPVSCPSFDTQLGEFCSFSSIFSFPFCSFYLLLLLFSLGIQTIWVDFFPFMFSPHGERFFVIFCSLFAFQNFYTYFSSRIWLIHGIISSLLLKGWISIVYIKVHEKFRFGSIWNQLVRMSFLVLCHLRNIIGATFIIIFLDNTSMCLSVLNPEIKWKIPFSHCSCYMLFQL